MTASAPLSARSLPRHGLPQGSLTAQWTVLITVCVLLFQALLGGPLLPQGIGLGEDALILCTDAGMTAGPESGGGVTRHDCGVVCQTACAAGPLLLRVAVLLPLPGTPVVARLWDSAVSTPAPSGPPLRLSARGPPLFS
ncbi:hypothetical protein [Novispirillum itersonii]|uniref:DUF2946 domain-containing protein n=1 Tax=Novispirillum itersonii TaxID=189 RepID=A0A7X0DNJ4_NOVIT|nr:hypothetical protein [Novispirillum itersonii]MBB6210302.1 hypothetical protein [Novispirillum itersonii]